MRGLCENLLLGGKIVFGEGGEVGNFMGKKTSQENERGRGRRDGGGGIVGLCRSNLVQPYKVVRGVYENSEPNRILDYKPKEGSVVGGDR